MIPWKKHTCDILTLAFIAIAVFIAKEVFDSRGFIGLSYCILILPIYILVLVSIIRRLL